MSKSPKKSKSLTRAGNRPATISAQQTIPYVRMLPDGICQLPGGVYTKTLEYEDINYSVASAEEATESVIQALHDAQQGKEGKQGKQS